MKTKSLWWCIFFVGMCFLVGSLKAYSATPYAGSSKLTAYDGAQFDLFGISVDISPSGGIALIGASQGTSSVDPGKAYFFSSVSSSATVAKITAGDPAAGGDFGHAIMMADNGTTIIIGSPDAKVENKSYQGAAYIYTKTGSWTQQAKLVAPDGATESFFGCSADISDDGNTVIIGSWGADRIKGAAYVFTRSGSNWSMQQKLTAVDGAVFDQFGFSVALSGDGNTALVGANNDNLTVNFDYRGSAYIFVRSGTLWSQQAKLTAADGAQYDYLGNAVDLSDDGNTALIGASWKNAAYLFTRNGSLWTQQKKLTASDSGGNDRFGQSVALSNNGNIAVVGAEFAGAAYLFIGSGSSWNQQQKLVPSDVDASGFGGAVAVADDGQTILVGADEADVGSSISQGVVYIFRPVIPLSGMNFLLLKP